jgi:P2 family phage contractile tail tube protein
MATIYVPEAMNIFVGTGADASKHLTITENTLPILEEKTVEHHAGGSIGALEIGGLGLVALTQGFNLSGYDPQTMGQFGAVGTTNNNAFTTYGVMRDKQGNTPFELRCVTWGRLTKIQHSTFKRGELANQTHEIKEITHYELYWGGKEKYYYDFFSSVWRVDGVDQNQAANSIMRIPGAA